LNTVFMVSLYGEIMTEYSLLAILNSSLLRAYWIDRFYDQRKTFPKIKGTYLKELPVIPKELAQAGRHRLVELDSLAREASRLAASAHEVRLEGGSEVIGRRRDALERQMDDEVYALFGVSPDAAGKVGALLERFAVASGQ
ncbi:MAG: TaqI-like C-terminal specificity domain-containing protein, partial [Bacillota bacterium]|nr:TaqI-like C-terminal specificity domain-containing protein [Bacillota bacterium]